jgi:hypothetical protein
MSVSFGEKWYEMRGFAGLAENSLYKILDFVQTIP